ncbi:hypothetical protein, partial [Streptobacillus moniliformis]|uniref:hypothetical protein n=1 Tax=Streptobacillus moniliformis TaxID=34105 RepID=UPI001E4BA828
MEWLICSICFLSKYGLIELIEFVKIDLEKIDLILLELYIILTPFCYLVWRLNYTEKEEVIQEFFLKFLITFF